MLNPKHLPNHSAQGNSIYTSRSTWLLPAILMMILIPCIWIGIPLFHTLVELFAIGIAMMSFVIAWNTYPLSKKPFLLYLGCGYLWVGVIDLAHTLTFADVGVLPVTQVDTTLKLWIIARFFEAFILLSSVQALNKSFNPSILLLSFGLFSFFSIAAVAYGLVPQMLIPGQGLTKVKVFSEYLIIVILLISMFNIYQRREQISLPIARLLLASIACTALAELCFTLYTGLKSVPIVIGHLFKLLSFWLIYRIVIESSLLRPFKSLSRVVSSYDTVTDDTVIVDEHGIIRQANKVVRQRLGRKVIGRHCHDAFHCPEQMRQQCPICQSIELGNSLPNAEFKLLDSQQWFEASVSAIHVSEDFRAMVYSQRNITMRKHAELQFISLNRLYRVLSHANQAIARTSNQNALFQEICNIAVNQGGFKMAWIGVIDGLEVRPEFIAGEESGYLREMHMRVDNSEHGRGPVGTAAKTRQVACVNDVHHDVNFKPWRDAAVKRGYEALAAVPLLLDAQVTAIFTLYSSQKNAFDAQMLELLSSLSTDISAAMFNLKQLHQKQLADETIHKLSSAVEQSHNAVVITTTGGQIEYCNARYCNMTGYEVDETVGHDLEVLRRHLVDEATYGQIISTIEVGESWYGEALNRRKDGSEFWALQNVSPIKNDAGEITHYMSTATDNTELHKAQETIKQLAFYDPLTDLANRRLLLDRLEQAVHLAKRNNSQFGVLLCDLDNFKTVNDSLGHEYGDKLLQHVASILKSVVRDTDTVARLGGDEFVLTVESLTSPDSLIDISDTILKRLAETIELSGNNVSVSSSIGIALYPQDGNKPVTLLRHADLAMYHAKDLGKNLAQFYQSEMNEKAKQRLKLENKLRVAIEHQAFRLLYQPQVDLQSHAIVGFEALIRWVDNDGSIISPLDFIPLAEETGLITQIGDWVIQQAVSDWSALVAYGFGECAMAVNVSAYQFREEAHLHQTIQQALSDHPNCDPKRFVIELTESTLIKDIEDTALALSHIKTLGISVSIDDFGTGYSSLNYLKRLPIDQLKIDRSFVQDLNQDSNDLAIIAAILAMSQKLELKVVAEGVDDAAQSASLRTQGCGYAQGFHFYKPMTLAQLETLASTQPPLKPEN